ncbi:MAG: hypothetical protein NTV46_12070, partial [Verrucomicrobia bacterium]|nr:hypothetical protein [Verrucomicrobiota bacterium]
SADNCYMLGVSPSGAASLVTIVGGKKASLTAPALANDKWTTVRVEIDGTTMTIFYDNQKVASCASTFRPLAVFPGGCVKRNFIAAARDGTKCFQGTLDHVRIYSVIHQDFAKDGIVPEISSRRVDKSFLSRFDDFKKLNTQRLKAWQDSPAAKEAPGINTSRLKTWYQQGIEIRKEREGLGKEEIAALAKAAQDFEKEYEGFRIELGKKFDVRPDAPPKPDHAQEPSKQQQRDEFIRKNSMTMLIELKKKQAAVDTCKQRFQMLNNADEYYGLGAWGSGWNQYERSIGAYLARYQQFALTEDEKTLQQVLDAQQSRWVAEIDWDSRLDFEMGGPEKIQPHQLRWLKRMKPYIYK